MSPVKKKELRVKPNDTGCKWAVQKNALKLASRREPASDKCELKNVQFEKVSRL